MLALIGLGAYSFLRIDPEVTQVAQEESAANQVTTYTSPALGLTFAYRPGPSGYVIEEREPAQPTDLLGTVVAIQSADVGQAPEGGEGPPTITMQAFKNATNLAPEAWAEANVQYSNINLKMGEVQTTQVNGAPGIRYMADGLYASENVVVARGETIYIFTGMFMDENSDLRRDFAPLLNSVRFTGSQ